MNIKHLKNRILQCGLIASNSPCPRRKVGALIVDPDSNVVISEGYNGTPRGSGDKLCGGSVCLRDCDSIQSGTSNDVGCHHAEMNAILNAARVGQSTMGKWLIVDCDPCLMCAKAIHHSGIRVVYCPSEVKEDFAQGLSYLKANGVLTFRIGELSDV